jgi:deoxyadenosine/deoxycytidine kinase
MKNDVSHLPPPGAPILPSWINPPKPPDKPRRIILEGLIGAGKTSAATLLAKHTGYTIMEEPVAANPFLSLFYQDPSRWAYPMQNKMLFTRYGMERAGTYGVAAGLFPGAIYDRSMAGDTCFAELNTILGHMSPEEYHLYLNQYELLKIECPYPDIIVFLEVPLSIIRDRIKQRGNEYEQDLLKPGNNYLELLAESYERFCTAISQYTIVLRIDWHIFRPIEHLWEQILKSWQKYSQTRFQKILLKW